MESWVNIGQHYGTISILLLLIKQQSVVDSQSMRQSICTFRYLDSTIGEMISNLLVNPKGSVLVLDQQSLVLEVPDFRVYVT